MLTVTCATVNGAIAPRKFHGVSNWLQICGNLEYRASVKDSFVTYSDFCCELTRSTSVISIQQGSKEFNCVVLHLGSSCTEVVLNDIPAFPERFKPSCHFAIWPHYVAACFKKSLETFCVLRPCGTSILIQERYSSFVNMS